MACQGVEGAYQQIAVDRMFRRPTITYYNTFEAVFEAVESGAAEFGVLPIENSTAGSVNHVYDLMMRHDFFIVRSCRLKIDHNLLVKPGTHKEDVRIVYSHQQAINQCADYIAKITGPRARVREHRQGRGDGRREPTARRGRHRLARLRRPVRPRDT